MRFVCLLLLSFYSRLTDCVKKPVLNQARALSSSLIYLSWKGPIDHPGGFKYRIYLKKGSSPIRKHADISGSAWYYILKGLKGNIRYTVCVGLVDRYDKTNSICHSSAIITMPAQRGHVSRTDRKYLTKGEYYQAARHYWPFDYETNLRDIKYSVAGAVKGSGVSIMGKGRGFLTTNGSGWIRMGRFKNECLCDARYCRKDGFSVSLWVKLSSFENRTKVLLGSDDAIITKTTGLVIFQSTRATGNRYVSAVVFMVDQKWKCRSQVEPGTWFYLTVTWKESTGLRMYKDGFLMSARKRSKHKPYPRRWVNHKCAVSLSPKSANTPLVAHYDDLVVWYYELNSTEIADVLKSSYEPPKVKECKTKDGKSLNIVIEDDNVYEMKNDYKASWIKTGDRQGHSNRTNNRAYHISGLETSSEYSITVQRRIRKNMFSRASEIICNTRLRVPSKPRKFRVREKSSDYLFLRWQPPEHVYGIIRGYKISYRVNDFTNSKWIAYFQPNVQRIHLYDLKPFTDYVIKLLCQNDEGSGAEAIIEATTGEGVPDAPRRLRVSLKRNFLFIKWKEPLNMNGKIDYRVFVSVDGNTTMVCNHCGQYYKMDDIDQNTTYTFWVVAYNVNNDSRFVSQGSNNFTITTPSFTPSVPRSVVANLTYNGIQVLWTEPKTPNGDVDYRLTGLVNESRNVFCSKCGLSYLVTNVSRNTVYSFWVVAYNVRKGYESAESAKVDIDTTLFVPSDPSSVTVAFSPEGILVSWNKSHVSQGVIQYKLFAMVNGSRRLLCSKCGLKYLIKNVEHNVNYFVWVTAYNVQNGYESASSPVVHFSTTGLKPQAPENLLAPEIKDGSATIRWNPPGGTAQDGDIIGYKVTLYDGHKIIRTIITQSLQLEFKNLTQFSKYYVTVQVLSKAGVYGPPSAQLVIQTEDKDECLESETPCSKHAVCTNSLGSFFCSCLPMYIGDGVNCEALPVDTTNSDFCPGEHARNITWKRTFRGHSDKNLCPNGTVGISTRKCINGNGTRSYWADPNLSNCVSAWMTAMDDKLADPTLNSSVVGDFFLNLLDENLKRGLYGGDVIKSVEVIDILYNKSKENELDEQQPNPELAKNVVETFVNITQNIISPKTLKVWKDIPKNRRTENGAKMIESLENAVVQSAKIVNYSSIQNEHMDVRYGDVTSFESKYKRLFPLDEDYNELNSIKFPQSLQRKRKDTTGRTSVAVIKYKTIGSVLSAGDHEASDEEFLNSAVLSVTMDPPLPSPFQEPLEFLLKNQEDGKFDNQKCVFFNTSRYPGSWSTNGCVVFNASADFTVCHCYHMTSFSVLMQVSDVELSYSDALILGWITRIGLCISLIALGFAFITFMCLPRPCGYRNGSKCFKLCEAGYRPTYLKKVRTSIHSNLIFSLALGEALFLWGIEKTGDKVTCYTVAVSLHYLFLVAFHWMAAEGVILYLVLVKVFQRKSAKKDKRMFMVICWGTPAAIVCISLAVGYENYLHEKCCWLSVTHGLIWSFAGPALTIILVNVFFLCCTFRVMGKRQRWEKKEKHMADRIRYWAKGAAIVTCLLGVTWIFGVFFINSDSVVLAYLFNICNVFQGLFIFVFHCLLDEKIRQRYYQVFCAVSNGESRSHSHSTGTIKKERRRSTFNSWLWTLAPAKFQDSKSESCPTVGENILKRLESQSTHSLSHSPNIGRKLQEIKMQGLRPRGMSSIYHDSDENMDNIPDKIVIVKHNSRTNNENLECEENSTAGMFPSEDYWISTLSRENSQQFLQVPQMTCEDCLYEVREWEDQQELEIRKTNSLHEQVLKKHIAPSSTNSQEESKSDTDDESSDEETTDNSVEEINKDKTTKKYTTFTTVVPQIILSDYTNKEVISTSKVSQMVQMINSKSREGNSQKKLFGSTAV